MAQGMRSKTQPSGPRGLGVVPPPQNLEAEKAVIGAILKFPDCLDDVIAILSTPWCFYSAAHQQIWKAVLSLSSAGKPISILSVAEEIASVREGMLTEIGGAPTLLELHDETMTAVNVAYHAGIVYDSYVRREIINVCFTLIRDASEKTGPAEELLETAESQILGIQEARVSGEIRDISSLLATAISKITARHKRKDIGAVTGPTTGFAELDELTCGWQPGNLIILAARPSMGKSAIALQFAHAAAAAKHPALFLTLEMTEDELCERLFCCTGRINSHQLRRGSLPLSEQQRCLDVSAKIPKNLWCHEPATGSLAEITAVCRRFWRKHNISLIVIDYLQLIEPEDRTIKRHEQIGVISRRLKRLAIELSIPIIALSQLNRAVESRSGKEKRPRMSDLRESGSLEQDADLVLLLHRPEYYEPERLELAGIADLYLEKQRSGPTGKIHLVWQKEFTRFETASTADVWPIAESIKPFGCTT